MSAQLTMIHTKDQMPPRSPDVLQGKFPSVAEMPVADSSDNYNRVLEVSHILHSSLSAEEILRQFSIEISKEVILDGLIFTNTDEQIEVQIGTGERYSLEYTITLHDSWLGQLQLSRKEPFTEDEIMKLEDFSTALVYPLLNAFSYARAIRTSFQDPLTGANNRAALQHDLERECALARRTNAPLSLLLLDIDNFKSVNDHWGHQSGDLALKEAAATVSDSTRGSDMLYRYGGEEFLVILACTPAEGAALFAERIRKNIAAMQVDSDTGCFGITTSIGVSTLNENDDISSLIRRADEALYQAKRSGRNLVKMAD